LSPKIEANHGDRRGSTSPCRGDRNFFKIKITRKMMDLFFTQDLESRSTSKAIHYGGSL